ncbi:MAG TPA: DUF4398 domain-containing protein [Usitatibacter sp.]|nr:DUF4398 domain-containing protein [Usitatibacter sp.]
MKKPACIVITSALLASGCAAHRAPTLAIDVSSRAIARAESAGAERLAPEDIRRARDKLALTGRWMAVRDHEPARWLAEQAEVDAELARARSIRSTISR